MTVSASRRFHQDTSIRASKVLSYLELLIRMLRTDIEGHLVACFSRMVLGFNAGGLRRYYNPAWFNESIPAEPYDPLILRHAFEKVS